MQEIKKRRILLASVLKPVDEPRMFERMGLSLAANGHQVFIAGMASSANVPVTGIQFLPHTKFKRFSLSRIAVRFEILRKVFSIKPDLFVITTPELIGVAILYKIFSGRKIIYDIQENYSRNIRYTDAWPKLIKPILAALVRLKEVITSPFFSKFLLAEKCYESELPFTKGKSVVVENKCRVPDNFERKPSSNSIKLIFTGTIAESTGVFQSIDLAKKLHAGNPQTELVILGRCTQPAILDRIKSEIATCDFITLVGGGEFVTHEIIMKAIAEAHFGIVFYPTSKHTENKIPSKLYEYLACGLPILLQNNTKWIELCEPYSASIVIDLYQTDISLTLKQMSINRFYTINADDANWRTEEIKLIAAINSIK